MKDYREIYKDWSLEKKAEFLTGIGMKSKPLEGYEQLSMADGPAGVRTPWNNTMEGGDVAFPTESALGATWNPEIVNQVGRAIGENCVAHDVNLLLAPAVNMHRTPLCGRNYEYFSEDPYLTGTLGTEYIKGVQSQGVGTTLKHFACNNQELFRGLINSEVDERTLREHYLLAFETIVKNANPTAVMCAYNKLNGQYCSENGWLNNKVLRQEWGYDGAVVSDWGAVHDEGKAVKNGMDLVMPEYKNMYEDLKRGLEAGYITMEDIDRAVNRVIDLIDKINGMKKTDMRPYDRKKIHDVAKKAADEAIVLLKNEDNILPIKKGQYKKIGVLGLYAEHPQAISGEGGSGSVTVAPESISSCLEYIKKYAGEETEVLYEPLYDLYGGSPDFPTLIAEQKICKNSDIVLMFAGYPEFYEVEGEDRERLDLPFYMVRLIREACRFNKNVVVITQTGAAYAPFMKIEDCKGLVQAWFCGEGMGESIADVIFGNVNPSGKLQSTFMKELDPDLDFPGDGRKVDYKEKMFVGYRYYDKHPEKIWYPFGHGLSYTTFEYSDLSVTPEKSKDKDQEVKVTFKIKNTGDVYGGEVAQLYVKPMDTSVVRPIKELKGFKKVFLNPGEETQVEITLNSRSFAYYNINMGEWHVESGKYGILIGSSSRDIRLEAEYSIDYEDLDDYTILRERWYSYVKHEMVGNE